MTESNWCNQNYWYLDDTLSTRSTFIPRDTIDDTNIVKKNYTYVIAENACFQKIPSLVCNNLNIIGGSDTLPPPQFSFTCALLEASNVTCGANISLGHWEPNTFCEWTVSSLLTASGCVMNYLILDANSSSGTGLNTTFASLQNCYIKTNNLYLDNTSISSFPYITKILCTSGILVSSTINDRVVCEGDFAISGTTTFGGSGDGTFVFNESSINLGTINGLTTFNDSSINQGIVYSNVLFSGASTNNGIVVGDCVFLNGTKNLGTISGNALFSGSSINSGTIINNSFFNSGSINFGIVSGISKFDAAMNQGTISESYFTNSNNGANGLVTGISSFDRSVNFGLLNNKYADFAFVNNSRNEGTIIGNVSFGVGCFNYGAIISGSVMFRENSTNYGNITSDSIAFTDDSNNSSDGITNNSGLTIFSKNAINNGSINGLGSVEFYNLSLNTNGTFNSGNFYHQSINSGTPNIAYFYQDAANFKTVNSGIFNDDSINKPDGFGNNLCFNNDAINSGFAGTGNFADNSCNYGTGINLQFCHTATNFGTSLTNAIFWGNSINKSGSINQAYIVFNEQSKNYADAVAGCQFTFKDKSINYASLKINNNFNDFSQNYNFIESGNFNDFSKHNAEATGINLLFGGASTNNGTVNVANFYDISSNLNMGKIIINGIFYNYSTNKGIIVNSASFNNYSENKAKLSGVEIGFRDYAQNSASLIDCTVSSFESFAANKGDITNPNNPIIFTNETINSGNIKSTKNVSFNDSAKNYGSIILEWNFFDDKPKVVFNGNPNNYMFSSVAINEGDITSVDFIEFSSARNYGRLNTATKFRNNSMNSGSINFAFFDSSINYGSLNSGYFDISSINFGNLNYGEFKFSENYGNINLNASFNYSKNISGNIGKDALFNQSSNLDGNIGNDAIFDFSSNTNGNIGGSGIFINRSSNSGTYYSSHYIGNDAVFDDSTNYFGEFLQNATFKGASINYDGIVHGSGIFEGTLYVNGPVFANNTRGTILGNALFSFAYNFGNINGSATIANSSVNGGTISKNAKFISDSRNLEGAIVIGDAEFIGYSTNIGSVYGNAVFIDHSCNPGVVSGTVTTDNTCGNS